MKLAHHMKAIIGCLSICLSMVASLAYSEESVLPDVNVSYQAGQISVDLEKLYFSEVGLRSKLIVEHGSDGIENLNIFVRDRSIVDWDQSTKELISREPGSTEVFVVHGKSMAILPVVVGFYGEDRQDRKIVLEGFDANIPKETFRPELDGKDVIDTPTLAEAKRENRVQWQDESVEFVNVTLKFSDDRSDLGQKITYPAVGLGVRVAGHDLEYETDARGMVFLQNIPKHSHLSVVTRDVKGLYASSIHNVSVGDGQEMIDLHALRQFHFDNNARIAEVVQDANLSSVCLTVFDEEGKTSQSVVASIDVGAEGPFYYNKYGYLDDKLSSSSDNGRVCFYNVEPAIGAIYVSHEDGTEQTVALDFISGLHREEAVHVADQVLPSVAFVPAGTAYDFVEGENFEEANKKFIDDVSVFGFGQEQTFASTDDSMMTASSMLTSQGGRSWVFVDDEYFEPTIYGTTSLEDHAPMLPLFPRGFVEDMAVMANVVQHYATGTVTARFDGGSEFSGEFVLTDSITGQKVGEPYYYGKGSTLKAMFFNLLPGQYVLNVRSVDGEIVSSDTVLVYSDSLSYSLTGRSPTIRL